MSALHFPPLFYGQAVSAETDPFAKACADAQEGCDAGRVVYHLGYDVLRGAIIFAPEDPLADAMAILPVCGVGFQNALGALAPPEVAVHLDWNGAIRINGARAGRLRVESATHDPKAEPLWIVVGLELRLWPPSDDPGHAPDDTALFAEGCADVNAGALMEAWVRHTLVGINRWSDDGTGPVHQDWCALAHGIGAPVTMSGKSGTFLGVDERFGMLLRDEDTTHLIPLTRLLEDD